MSLLSSLLFNNMQRTLESGIRKGRLELHFPDGRKLCFGEAGATPHGIMIIKDLSAIVTIASKGDIGFGETYMEDKWDSPDLEKLIQVFVLNVETIANYGYGFALQTFLLNIIDKYLRRNSLKGSKKNIMAHYDLSNDFYKLWLDKSMTYSSALFKADDTLEQAQANKYNRILDNISGGSVLEIGCGWGGFAEKTLSQGRKFKGLTLSPAQKAYADKRLSKDGAIVLQDYREEKGVYDSIVSIEMFEAVGEAYWNSYFERIKLSLHKNGEAIIQTITIQNDAFDAYRRSSDYIRRHIFPGGLLPSPQKFVEAAHNTKLQVVDNFEFGLDYAKTLRLWCHDFDAKNPAIMALGFSESFIRGWRMYLLMCAAAFQVKRTNVSQFKLVHA